MGDNLVVKLTVEGNSNSKMWELRDLHPWEGVDLNIGKTRLLRCVGSRLRLERVNSQSLLFWVASTIELVHNENTQKNNSNNKTQATNLYM